MLQLLPLERSHFAPLPPALGAPHGEVELFPVEVEMIFVLADRYRNTLGGNQDVCV